MIDCPKCKENMIWGGDNDVEDADGNERIESNLSCPNCKTDVYVIWGIESEN